MDPLSGCESALKPMQIHKHCFDLYLTSCRVRPPGRMSENTPPPLPSWEGLPLELLEKIFGSIPRLLLPTVSLVCGRWQTAVHGLAVRYLTGCIENGLTDQQQLERWGWSTAAAAWQNATAAAAWQHSTAAAARQHATHRSCSCIRLAFHFFTRDETPVFQAVFRIHLFLSLPDPLVRGMDPDPDPSIIKQKNSKKNLDFCYFVTFFWTLIFEKLCKCTFRK
jgi:hypothetical protein